MYQWPPTGARVAIYGMDPDPHGFNGKTGTALGKSYYPGRYMVKLDDEDEPKPVHIFPSNLDSL